MIIFVLVSPDLIFLGCFHETDRVHQYVIPETFDNWRLCREECNSRRAKVTIDDSVKYQTIICNRLRCFHRVPVNVDV